MKRSPVYVGIDIGKDVLDVAATGLSLRVPNTKAGCMEMFAAVRALKKHLHFVCEPTGPYGRTVIGFLHARRSKVSVISGYRVRQFAKATGLLAKTDPIDAALLARVGRTLRPAVTAKLDRVSRHLRDIMRRRWQLLMVQADQKRQRAQFNSRLLRKTADHVIQAVGKEVALLNSLGERTLQANPILDAKRKAFREVVGVGPVTALGVLAELPEVGCLNRREVASLAGLCPFNRDSSTSQRARHIFGGRRYLRIALYMAAVSAARNNPVLAPFYERLRLSGKPAKVAITAVARKLLIHLNHLARQVDEAESRSSGDPILKVRPA